MNGSPTNRAAGARESTAGDEFHLLWVVRRALAMLDPNASLRRIVVEGISPIDQAAGSADLLNGVDMTEYFGGESFSQADAVVVSQLKHSARKPGRTWTAARLAQKGSRGQPGTVERLAEIFKAFIKTEDREQVLKKLSLRLVSNQPLQAKFAKTSGEAQQFLRERPEALNLKQLLESLSASGREEVIHLYRASKLQKREFVDFLRLLDLSELGTGERWQQEAKIVNTLGAHLLEGASTGARALVDLARKHAMPDEPDVLGLNRESVLAHLGVGPNTLFPLPPRFTVPDHIMITPDSEELAEAVLAKDANWVVAHGDAGVGKTTTVCTLETLLPSGSAVVTYDCFGRGQNLGGAQTRHDPKDALMQITNELSLRCGTPPLLSQPQQTSTMWRHFEVVLKQAGESITDLGGRLVLAIDAIDNAVVAGRQRLEKTFVPDLMLLTPPAGVTILISCRTHRLEDVDPPSSAHRVELCGFDEVASTANLRRRFPEAETDTCRRFHERSNGNPRSQFYLLDPSQTNPITNAEQAADAAHKTPEAYFDNLWDAAVSHASDKASAQRHLAELVCLPRPARVAALAGVAALQVAEARNFCRGLVPGVHLSEDVLEFRDEDFETYLEGKVSEPESRAAYERIADYFSSRRDEDPEAAVQLARLLRLAGRDEQLIALCLEEGQPEAIKDPVARVQAYFGRLELAMQIAEHPGQRENALRLAVLAAQAVRTDKAVAAIVKQRPDLAMRFGDPNAVAQIYEDANRESWQGPMYLRVAALNAQLGNRAVAQEQLRMAEAWIERWMSLDSDKRSTWDFEASDIAAGAQAVYWLNGPEQAAAWISHWRPTQFVMEVVASLATDLALLLSARKVTNQMARLELVPLIEARAMAALYAAGHSIPKSHIARVAEGLLTNPPREKHRSSPWTVDFIELVARGTRDSNLLLTLLEQFGPPIPRHAPNARFLGDWEATLRLHCLRLTIEDRDPEIDDLLPDKLRADAEQPKNHLEREERASDRRRYTEGIGLYLLSYANRARVLLRRPSVGSLEAEIKTKLQSYIDASTHRWYRPDFSYRRWAKLSAEALRSARGEASQLLSEIAEKAATVESNGMEVRLSLGRLLIGQRSYHDLALGFLDRVATVTEESQEPADERAGRLLDVASIISPYHPDLAADYYRRAVEAAEGLDEEGAGLLALNAQLGSLSASQPDPRHPHLAERLARAIEGYRPFVTDADYLPWMKTATAITDLAPGAGLALMCRWDSEGILGMEASAAGIVPSCVERSYLSAEEGIALLRLGGEQSFSSPAAIRILETLRRRGAAGRGSLGRALEQLSLFVRRDLLPEARLRSSPSLALWLGEHGLQETPGGSEIVELASFAEHLAEPQTEGHISEFRSADERAARATALTEGSRQDGADQITTRLEELAEHWSENDEIESYLAAVGERLSPTQRLAALQALDRLPAEGKVWRRYSGSLLKILNRWLNEWQRASAIRKWATERLAPMLDERVTHFVSYEEVAEVALPRLMSMPCLQDPAAVLIAALGPKLDELSASQLYSLAEGLALSMSAQQQTDAVDWCLAQLETDTVPEEPQLPSEPSATLAYMFWALFAHSDKQVRWRAAHSARQLLVAPDPQLGRNIAALLDTTEGGAFVPHGFEFFWLSAQQWTMLVLARIADEAPNALPGLAGPFAHRARDTKWPHAAVRELSRRTALRLDEHEGGTLDGDQRDDLTLANQPRGCLLERGLHWHSGSDRDPGEDRRFSFDLMDTLPYWYSPLANVFAIDTAQIAEAAEHWIVDQLYFEEQRVEEATQIRDTGYRYQEISNDHGGSPRIESVRSYLEYHGMLLAAGNLLDRGQAISVDTYEDAEDPWASWVSRHIDAFEDLWAVDLRTPPPLQPENYGLLTPPEQWRERSSSDYDKELRVDRGADSLIVSSYVEVSNREVHGSASVSSALVSPETAGALMRALQTCKDCSSYRLPEVEDGIRRDLEIDEEEFRLFAWLQERRHEEDGLEEHDPLKRLNLSVTRPGQNFAENRSLQATEVDRQLVNGDGEAVAWTQAWSDEPPSEPDRHRRETYSAGRRLLVKLSELIEYLKSKEMDLIIDVVLRRQYSEHAGVEREERYEAGQSRIYILRRNGRLETMDGGDPPG